MVGLDHAEGWLEEEIARRIRREGEKPDAENGASRSNTTLERDLQWLREVSSERSSSRPARISRRRSRGDPGRGITLTWRNDDVGIAASRAVEEREHRVAANAPGDLAMWRANRSKPAEPLPAGRWSPRRMRALGEHEIL
jgi:hypothetical protein